MKKICIVLGTRPEIIKFASIIRHCEKNKLDYFIVHSNQHYSENMDKVFFEDLELPAPKYNLRVGSKSHGNQIGTILIELEKILLDEKPDFVIVQGDTNTVAAGALAASKLNIDLAHVEAGLRSYDRTMPEETNRIMTDHLSQYLFAPTIVQKAILIQEGIDEKDIYVVGNTAVDALLSNIDISEKKTNILEKLGLVSKKYILLTAHRVANVDIKSNLSKMIDALKAATEKYDIPFIYPIHPRTLKKIEEFGLELPKKIKIIDPLPYLAFIQLEKHAKIIITDSGGLQEEACVLRVPCITLRENTERPETIDVGANVLVGREKDKLLEEIENALNKPNDWENPYGSGKTGEKIIGVLLDPKN